MNIVGVVVNALPKQSKHVEQQLLLMEGVEVHAVNEKGNMVITVESEDSKYAADAVTSMHSLEGVLSAAMVYHNFE